MQNRLRDLHVCVIQHLPDHEQIYCIVYTNICLSKYCLGINTPAFREATNSLSTAQRGMRCVQKSKLLLYFNSMHMNVLHASYIHDLLHYRFFIGICASLEPFHLFFSILSGNKIFFKDVLYTRKEDSSFDHCSLKGSLGIFFSSFNGTTVTNPIWNFYF